MPRTEPTDAEIREYCETDAEADLAIEYRERVPDAAGSVPEYAAGDAWDVVFSGGPDAMDLTDAEAVDFEDWLLFQLDRHYAIMDIYGGVFTEIKALEAAYSDVIQRL